MLFNDLPVHANGFFFAPGLVEDARQVGAGVDLIRFEIERLSVSMHGVVVTLEILQRETQGRVCAHVFGVAGQLGLEFDDSFIGHFLA